MNHKKEDAYIKKIQKGEYQHYTYLIETYQNRLFTFINCIVKNRDDAHDLTQEVLFKTYRKIKSFKFKSKFSTWLFQIGYNSAINFIKKNKRRKDIEQTLPLPETLPRHEKEIELDELNNIINIILAGIDKNHQAALYLYYNQSKKYHEIAAIMKIPLNTVKSHLLRGKAKIKKELENKYQIDIKDISI